MTMSEAADFVLGGPASGLWPVLLLPFLSALLGARVSKLLPPTRADWRVAALLAASPGLVMVVLLLSGIGRSLMHLHPDDGLHFIEHHSIWGVALVVLVPAVVRAWKRKDSLRALVGLSRPAGPRLRRLADALDLHCRELPVQAIECFVAGSLRPVVYLSAGALAALTDAELKAALCHERAHIHGKDPALLAILSFFSDLVPHRNDAMRAFLEARERRADAVAAGEAGPVELASALLAFSRATPAGAIGIAGDDAGTWRLRAILLPELDRPGEARSPAPVRALAANAALLFWPAVQGGAASILCSA